MAAVPYDVVSTEEARTLAAREPLSFLRVSRAEVDLPAGTPPYSAEVYARAVTNMAALRRQAPLVREESPSLYVYRLEREGLSQTGVAGTFSIDEYETNLIKRHERTRKEKEDDRTRHIVELRAQTGPVFLVHRHHEDVRRLTARIVDTGEPLYDFTADDGVRHSVWRAPAQDAADLVQAFTAIDALYIADGHHRAASAARARQQAGGTGTFLAVAFQDREVRILPYNRVVLDLADTDRASFVRLLRDRFGATEGAATPGGRGEVSVFVDRWYRVPLAADGASGALDVTLLQERILEPVLGIGDVTRDKRIDFVGGGRGTEALEQLVRSGAAAVAFSMHPVSMDDIMRVSDAGGIMPPKSTWFEPKLRDGLLSHLTHE